MIQSIWILVFYIICAIRQSTTIHPERKFQVHESKQLLMDGKPFQYVAGEIHYFRVPKPYWKDRLKKMRTAGLNAISTCLEWSTLEPRPNTYRFEEDNDFVEFIKLADELGMYVILKPGPYIRAERDLGGLPSWLIKTIPSEELRTTNSEYKNFVEKWFAKMMPMIVPLLYGNGGPIIMVQVENEYGSYSCNQEYLKWLSDLYSKYVSDKAVLFTSDVPTEKAIKCGSIPGIFSTLTIRHDSNMTKVFEESLKRNTQSDMLSVVLHTAKPIYWGDHLKNSTKRRSDELTSKDFNSLLKMVNTTLNRGASLTIYMMHGGTNFGFGGGQDNRFKSIITSYDYSAPINEAGDPTPLYFALRNLIGTHLPLPTTLLPEIQEKMDFGKQQTVEVGEITEPVISDVIVQDFRSSPEPLTFEQMDLNNGYILYETRLPDIPVNDSDIVLNVEGVHDIGYVFIDYHIQGVLYQETPNYTLNLNNMFYSNQGYLQILVENQGRKFTDCKDYSKGLIGAVTINGHKLQNWTMASIVVDDITNILRLGSRKVRDRALSRPFMGIPTFYYSEFRLKKDVKALDSYLDTTGWGKGIAWFNGFMLGRYWPKKGPQVGLYIPGTYIRYTPMYNSILMFEFDAPKNDLTINFIKSPLVH